MERVLTFEVKSSLKSGSIDDAEEASKKYRKSRVSINQAIASKV